MGKMEGSRRGESFVKHEPLKAFFHTGNKYINSLVFYLLPFLSQKKTWASHDCSRHLWVIFWEAVLGLVGIELTFLMVLCFLFVARMVSMTQGCFGYCSAVLTHHQGCLSNLALPPKADRLGKGLGGDRARPADPKWPKGSSIPDDVMTGIKSEKEGRGAFFIKVFVFWRNCYA